MNWKGILILVIIALALGFAALRGYIFKAEQEPNENYITVRDSEVGFEFDYRTSPNGYILTDLEFNLVSTVSDPDFIKGHMLMLESDFLELQSSDIPREGPPVITISIFENSEEQSPAAWAKENSQYSNIGLARGEIFEEETLASKEAARFIADGLYSADTLVVDHDGLIFLFSGAYLVEDSPIRKDFLRFLETVNFTNIP